MLTGFKRPILFALCAPLVFGGISALAQNLAQRQTLDSRGKHDNHSPRRESYSPTLIDKVRRATEPFKNLDVAISQGWVQGTPCVSGPNSGAMGTHFVMPDRIGDGVLDAEQPEALIYEPLPGGAMRLVGVEFITLAEAWEANNEGAPSLEGHLLNYVGAPNRYGLPAFYELHVWVWQRNPNGTFADWNSMVSCDKQPGG